MTSLDCIMAYSNPRVLNKFRTIFNLSAKEAEEIFIELKKWLWLCAQRHSDIKHGKKNIPNALVIYIGMVIIDELWHVFILHTDDYIRFCDQYFDGQYIHHSPGSLDFIPRSEKETEQQIYYIGEYLGEETVLKWYEDFADRYSANNLLKLLKAPVFGRPCEQLK